MAPGQAVVKQEGGKKRLVIDYRGLPYGPDVAQYGQAMKDVVERLQEFDVDEVVLAEYYERIYNEEQTGLLKGIADVLTRFETDSVWSPNHLGKTTDSKALAGRHNAVLSVLNNLRSDPFKAYLTLVQEIKVVSARAAGAGGAEGDDLKVYAGTLAFMRKQMEETELIKRMKQYLQQLGKISADRTIYRTFFESAIKPSFIGSRIFFTSTDDLELVDQYEVVGSKVYIYKHPDKVEHLYFINPPEYSLPPEKYFLLEKTKEVVSEHRPETVGFMDIVQARKYFNKIYVATIADLALKNGIDLSISEKEELATIVARYTIGYGILEIILSDRRLTDVYIDSPLGEKPIYLVHSKYGQCQTNVIFSDEEAHAIVSRFRALSGRPFDEAHPILDFDLQDLQTRVAVIGRPLVPDGIGFALRLHKETPWTLPQFVDNGMFDATTAGLLSFFVDAQASMLIVGSRGSGKCLSGDALIQLADGKLEKIRDLVEPRLASALKKTDVGDGVYAECSDLEVFTLTPELKIAPAAATKVWRRTSPANLLKVRLTSGKELNCTPEHPFFVVRNGLVLPLRADALEQGEFIATPRSMAIQATKTANTQVPALLSNFNYTGCMELVQRDLKKIQKAEELTKAAEKIGLGYTTLQNLKNGVRNAVSGEEIRRITAYAGSDAGEYNAKATGVRQYHSNHWLSKDISSREVDADYARFLGLLLGDGHIDKSEVAFTNTDDGLRREFLELGKKLFNANGKDSRPKERSPTAHISSRQLSQALSQRFSIPVGKKADSQTLPCELLASKNPILAEFIKAYFDCDASVDDRGIEFCTASKEMARQIQCAFIRFGIVSRLKVKTVKGKQYWRIFIYGENALTYQQQIGFGLLRKGKKLEASLNNRKFNSNVDVVPNAWDFLEYTNKNYGFGKTSLDQQEIGRKKFQQLAEKYASAKPDDKKIQDMLTLSNSDLFWDKIESIEKIPSKEPFVYDLTVDVTHSFIANGVVAHNTSMLQSMMLEIPQNIRIICQQDTLELPIAAMKKLGFSVQALKTRPPLGGGTETEVSAEDALRTALRLGDSVLIVGEVRSTEAKALYEAMRIGAVGNVVMGTIHGESAYSIWDRVVNDLGVPTTSFKATDFAVVSAPIRLKGSLERKRRLIELTEVMKHWEKDPYEEDGFLDWMKYDAGKDALSVAEDNLRKSEWLQKVQRLRGLSFEDVWSEVLGRAAAKQYLVDVRRKYDLPRILEAEYSVRAHSKYLLLSDKQRQEFGSVDHKALIEDWKKWIDATLLNDLMKTRQ